MSFLTSNEVVEESAPIVAAYSPPTKNDSNLKIFVGGIEPNVTASIMSQYFHDFGQVVESTIMIDRITGRARGFGFVTMNDQASYDAVLAFSPHTINGKNVDVKPSFENSPPIPGTIGRGPYDATKNLHVSNLAPETTVEDLQELFQNHCEVKEVVLKTGFAFVNSSSIEEATKAMTQLQGTDFIGQAIAINYAKDYSIKHPNYASRKNGSRIQNSYGPGKGKGGGGGSQTPSMMYGYGGALSPVLQGAWLPMAQIFSEGHVMDNDGREWHYTGTDGSVQGPFPSKEMNAWRLHGFFSNDKNTSMRLAVPVTPPPSHLMLQHQQRQHLSNGQRLWNGGGGGGGRGIVRGVGGANRYGADLSTKNKIFVGGLEPAVTDEVFGTYFSRFGSVVNAHVMKDRETGRSRGFGFVTFEEPSDCEQVLSLTNHEINGKWVELRKAAVPGSMTKTHPYASYTPQMRDESVHNKHVSSSSSSASSPSSPSSQVNYPQFKLFIGGIDSMVNNDALRNYFQSFGNVVDSVVMLDKETSRSRGFGFVTMEDAVGFNNVFDPTVSHELNGKIMEVKPADPVNMGN